jgi:hypothetical protein
MANDEHVAMLKKGVEAWSARRRENPDILPDLSGATSVRPCASTRTACTAINRPPRAA